MKSPPKAGGFILTHEGESIMVRKSWQQKYEAASHTRPVIKKQKYHDVAQFTSSIFFNSRPQPMGITASIQGVSSLPVKLLGSCPLTHPQRFVSLVILNPIKLTT